MTQKIENLTEEDVAIVQNVYNKQTKGTLFLGSLFFILGLLAIFLSKFEIEYFSMCLAGVFAFCFSYYSNNQAKKISINDIKEIMTGLFLQDYSEKGQSRTLTLKIDDQEKYYRYSWGLNA